MLHGTERGRDLRYKKEFVLEVLIVNGTQRPYGRRTLSKEKGGGYVYDGSKVEDEFKLERRRKTEIESRNLKYKKENQEWKRASQEVTGKGRRGDSPSKSPDKDLVRLELDPWRSRSVPLSGRTWS